MAMLDVRIPNVEVSARQGWESAPFSPGDEGAEAVIPEPVVTTTWFEEEVHEAYLTIQDRESHRVITVIELLSPANKRPSSAGGTSYEKKRREIYYSPTHLVEIDLLRGNRMVPTIFRKVGPHGYLVHVSRERTWPRRELWGIRLPLAAPRHPDPTEEGRPGRAPRFAGRARFGLRSRPSTICGSTTASRRGRRSMRSWMPGPISSCDPRRCAERRDSNINSPIIDIPLDEQHPEHEQGEVPPDVLLDLRRLLGAGDGVVADLDLVRLRLALGYALGNESARWPGRSRGRRTG